MRHGRAVAIACCTLVLAAGCGTSSSSPGSSSTPAANTSTGATTSSTTVLSGVVPIAYRNIAISPETVKVKVGSTIRWTNYDTVEHNVTSESGPERFASADFGEGGTYQIIATKPGVIRYLCTIHPASMKGTIDVVR